MGSAWCGVSQVEYAHPVRSPPGALLRRVVAPANMMHAFQVVRDRDEADGIPSRQLLEYLADPAQRLSDLAAEVESGSFVPGAAWQVQIEKRSGGKRTLSIPPFRDRIVERAILHVIGPILDPEFLPWSFAYRAGLGVDDAVRAVVDLRDQRLRWAVRADFRDCFDSLDHARMIEALGSRIPDADVLNLVARFMTRSESDGHHHAKRQRGVAQGSSLSPLLANLYLHEFDLGMFRRGYRVVRYADDMVVAVRTETAARAALEAMMEEAALIDLDLGAGKTRVAPFAQGIEFLGVQFTDQRPPPSGEPDGVVPKRKTLFVTLQGSYVGISKGQVRVAKGDRELLLIPRSQVAQIVLFGAVGISSCLRTLALEGGIDVVFLSRRGKYLGRLVSPEHVNTDIVLRQYLRSMDEAFGAAFAATVVAGKIANMRTLTLRRGRGDRSVEVADAAETLERARHRVLSESLDVDSLLGIEGAASRAYFAVLGGLVPAAVAFVNRTRRPPRDPVNSALSFGYALLVAEVISACYSAGLDPHVGFLHRQGGGQPSLALDLMEEFRPLIVDTAVIELFRRGSLTSKQFRSGEGDAVLLTGDGRTALLKAYEERMLTVFSHVPSGTRTSYRRALFLQARQVASLIMGLNDSYRPVVWR